IRDVQGNSFELVVRVRGKPQQGQAAQDPGDEFLKSCYFINCDDARVRQLTRQAIGQEKDAWNKAVRIERWVHDNMKIQNFTEALATADEVARTLEGDCTEFSMLCAAMCRAAG